MFKFIDDILIRWGFKPQPVYRSSIRRVGIDVTSSVRKEVANKMGKMSGLMMNGLPEQDNHWDAERQLVFGPKQEREERNNPFRAIFDLMDEAERDPEKESPLKKFWRETIGNGRDAVNDVLRPLIRISHIGMRERDKEFDFDQRYFLGDNPQPRERR